MTKLGTELNTVLEELVQNHSEDFNYMIASIRPFSVQKAELA